MVFIRLNSCVLVLILLHVAIAHTHQDMEKILADLDNELEVAGNSMLNDNKAMYDGVPASAGVKRFRGRKMLLESLSRKQIIKQGLNEEGKKTSGNDTYASKKQTGNSKRHLKDQNKNSKLKEVNSGRQKASAKELVDLTGTANKGCSHALYSEPVSSSGNLECSSKSREPVPREFDNSSQNLESQKLLEASNGIVDLTNSDYPGKGGADHSPPINNDEPLRQEHDLLP